MPKPVPIRRSLLAGVLITIVLLGGGILALAILGSRKAIERVAQRSVEETVGHLDSELAGFFIPVTNNLRLLQAWGATGHLDLDDTERLKRIFVPFLEEHEQVSSLMIADRDGREFMLLQLPDKWLMRVTRPGEPAQVAEWTAVGPAIESRQDLDYDPRVRPWFEGAVAADGAIHWTDAYTFFTTKDLGITASVTFGDKYVIGLDILLNDLSSFAADLADGRRDVFVMTEQWKVIGLPGAIAPNERKANFLKRPDELGIEVIADAVASVDPQQNGEDIVAVQFDSGGEAWWGAGAAYRLSSDRQLWICVILPQRELLEGVQELRFGILGLTFVVLLFAIMSAVRLARRFSQPIEALVRESDRISQGELEKTEAIESRVMEVNKLATAHDRMRVSLQTLFKLERDLRIARQIQQDTFPDKLPVLPGYDIAAWSDPADETGGDTYDVVGITTENGERVLSQAKGERALMLLADATGHGIGPALSVTQVRAMLRMAARREFDLAQLAHDMNDQLCADLESGRFVTAWFGELDAASHTIRNLSAGQAPLLHYRAAADEFVDIGSDLPPLGILSSIAPQVPPPIVLESGDVFAVFSDGIFEAGDGAGDYFGEQRVMDVIRANRAASAEDILLTMRDAVATYTNGAPAADDQTGVIVKRR